MLCSCVADLAFACAWTIRLDLIVVVSDVTSTYRLSSTSTSTSTCTWFFAITYKLLQQRWRKNCVIMQTDKPERKLLSRTLLSDKVLLYYTERSVWAVSVTSQKNELWHNFVTKACPMWPHYKPTLAKNPFNCCAGDWNTQGSQRRQMELVEWGFTLVPECQAVGLDIVHV